MRWFPLLFSLCFSVTNCAVYQNVTLTLTTAQDKYLTEDGTPPLHKVYIESNDSLESYVNVQPLEIVKIEHQHLPELPENSVSNLPKVEEIQITYNDLTAIQPGAFKNLPLLRYLNLSYNLLEEVQNGVFVDLSSLNNIYLEHNRIHKLGDTVFGYMPSLRHVFIGYNALTIWKSSWFTESPVESINMEHNSLEELPAEAFAYYTARFKGDDVRLWYLMVNDNNLKSIHPDAFVGLTDISYLDLKNNSLEELPNGVFRTVRYINNLVLSDNKIADINVAGVFNSTKLTYVKLDNNRLSCVERSIAEVNEVYSLNLEGNPITCDCVKQWEEWQKNNKTVVDVEKINNGCI